MSIGPKTRVGNKSNGLMHRYCAIKGIKVACFDSLTRVDERTVRQQKEIIVKKNAERR